MTVPNPPISSDEALEAIYQRGRMRIEQIEIQMNATGNSATVACSEVRNALILLHRAALSRPAPLPEVGDLEALKLDVYINHIKKAGWTDADIAEKMTDDPDWNFGYQYGGQEAVEEAIDFLASQGHLHATQPPPQVLGPPPRYATAEMLREWANQLDGISRPERRELAGVITMGQSQGPMPRTVDKMDEWLDDHTFDTDVNAQELEETVKKLAAFPKENQELLKRLLQPKFGEQFQEANYNDFDGKEFLFFTDLSPEGNFNGQYDHYRTGLVISDWTDGNWPQKNMKDMFGIYFGPEGELEDSWLSLEDVRLTVIDGLACHNLVRAYQKAIRLRDMPTQELEESITEARTAVSRFLGSWVVRKHMLNLISAAEELLRLAKGE